MGIILLTKIVKTKWNAFTKKWYVDKGYIYTKMGEEFEVRIEDLPNGSNAPIDVECDECHTKITKIPWKRYNDGIKRDGNYYCQKCILKLFSPEKAIKTKLKNNISFYGWCYKNLSKSDADEIMARWDYELNIDAKGNEINPKNVTYCSAGLNRKGYWFKCLNYAEHKSEQKYISNLTIGSHINCNKCNTISITHPHLIKYLVNKDDARKYSRGYKSKVLLKCPDCGNIKRDTIPHLIERGFSCNCCSDGFSYPEKFMFNVLKQLLDNDFETQLSKTRYNWCDKYRYDFYIQSINCIIETHGLQHYEEPTGNWSSFEDIKNIDKDKEALAKNNNISEYIVIDCRKSELEWIKNSIMQSKLPLLLNFTENNIDWIECHKYACSSLVKKACDLWNEGVKDTKEVANKLQISRATAIKYLKQGAQIEWCDY